MARISLSFVARCALCACLQGCLHSIPQSLHSPSTKGDHAMNRAFEALTRRGAVAAAAAAAALAAMAHRLSGTPALRPIPIAPPKRLGYRTSEHVRRYYQSTRL
jgi:hypothetical protein